MNPVAFLMRGDFMKHKEIQIRCPVCSMLQNPISANMGDKILKCSGCGKHMKYHWRSNVVTEIRKPAHNDSGGTELY